MTMSSPYLCADVQAACQDALHPGGLEQTHLAVGLAGFSSGDILLDMGCGKGTSLRFLRETFGVSAFGMEPAHALACYAKPYVVTAQAPDLPFGNNTLDGVLSECVLSLVDQRELAVSEIFRVLRPGGRLVVSDVILRAERHQMLDAARGCIRGALPLQSIVEQLETAGFEIRIAEDHSRVLADFAARLVFAGVSLKTFFPTECEHHANAKVGYGLIIARKPIQA